MKDSFLHCFWTGGSFPYALRLYIKTWVRCFQKSKSSFKLIVWLTGDSFDAARKFLNGYSGIGNWMSGEESAPFDVKVNVFSAKLSQLRFYIARFDPLIAELPPKLQEVIPVLSEKGRLTSVSNIARVAILRRCGGIYSDIDFLLPRRADENDFPKHINEFKLLFNNFSNKNFYLPIYFEGDHYLVENQCMVYVGNQPDELEPILRDMNEMVEAFFDQIRYEAENEAAFQSLPATKALKKSYFNTPETEPFLKAYQKRDFQSYVDAVEHYFAGVVLPGKEAGDAPVPAVIGGTRHDYYKRTGIATYDRVADFFLESIGVRAREYATNCWSEFSRYFNLSSMRRQFEFRLGRDFEGMYSWANPGYSQLVKLEAAACKLQLAQKKLVPKPLLDNLVAELSISVNAEVPKYRNGLKVLRKALTDAPDPLPLEKDALYLSLALEFFMCFVGGLELKAKASRLLNEPRYLMLRKLIDPAAKHVGIFDLLGFIRTIRSGCR